jgi:hypothetical protein
MRRIKKERRNLEIAANFLGVCSALNVNTVLGSLMLLFGKNPYWPLILIVPGVFFYYFTQRYFLFPVLAVRLTKDMTNEELMSNKKMWIGIIYSFLSIFLFWGVLFFIHWLKRQLI